MYPLTFAAVYCVTCVAYLLWQVGRWHMWFNAKQWLGVPGLLVLIGIFTYGVYEMFGAAWQRVDAAYDPLTAHHVHTLAFVLLVVGLWLPIIALTSLLGLDARTNQEWHQQSARRLD